jgi:hypothetical protein
MKLFYKETPSMSRVIADGIALGAILGSIAFLLVG